MYTIIETRINGCIEIIPRIFQDHRGITVKPFHQPTFKQLGLPEMFHEELTVKSYKHVIRGLHFQKPPFEQAKLITCLKGSILDVGVDLRAESKTYGEFVCLYLDEEKHNMAYIPEGFAHGYCVLSEEAIVNYKMSSVYAPQYEDGIRWDSLDIPWGVEHPIISEKDKRLPILSDKK